jgi:hypothetical protein
MFDVSIPQLGAGLLLAVGIKPARIRTIPLSTHMRQARWMRTSSFGLGRGRVAGHVR